MKLLALIEFQLLVEDLCEYAEKDLKMVKEIDAKVKMNKRRSSWLEGFELPTFEEDRLIEEIYSKRKQFKYSSIVVMLCAALEQGLVDLYEELTGHDFSMPPKKGNGKGPAKISYVLDELQKLGIHFESDAKIIRMLRNEIMHETFNLKKAKKNLALSFDDNQYKFKSKELVEWLIKDIRYGFIENVTVDK